MCSPVWEWPLGSSRAFCPQGLPPRTLHTYSFLSARFNPNSSFSVKTSTSTWSKAITSFIAFLGHIAICSSLIYSRVCLLSVPFTQVLAPGCQERCLILLWPQPTIHMVFDPLIGSYQIVEEWMKGHIDFTEQGTVRWDVQKLWLCFTPVP